MNSIKKVSFSVAALALAAVAFAGPDLDTRVQSLEKDMHCVKTTTASGTVGARTASARPEVDGTGFLVSFDVMYWHAKTSGTEYAYSTINSGAPSLPIDGQMREIGFGWDWGFNVGLGVNFAHGGWDVIADYTYFRTNGSSSVSSGTGNTVVPQKGDPILPFNSVDDVFTYADKAASQLGIDLDRVNLELGRNYYVSHNLSFRPHVGLATAWINLEQTTRFTGGQLGVNTVHVKSNNDFWGLGPRTGVDSKWYLTNGFSVFGNASGALLYGHYEVEYKNWYSAVDARRIKMQGNMHRFSPTAQIHLGLAYDQYIRNNKQHIGVSLGYDCQYWWSINQSFDNADIGTVSQYVRVNGDMSFHGVTLHLRLDF